MEKKRDSDPTPICLQCLFHLSVYLLHLPCMRKPCLRRTTPVIKSVQELRSAPDVIVPPIIFQPVILTNRTLTSGWSWKTLQNYQTREWLEPTLMFPCSYMHMYHVLCFLKFSNVPKLNWHVKMALICWFDTPAKLEVPICAAVENMVKRNKFVTKLQNQVTSSYTWFFITWERGALSPGCPWPWEPLGVSWVPEGPWAWGSPDVIRLEY